MTFRPELIDELLKEYRNPEDLMGEGGIFKQLTKALIKRCLSAEQALASLDEGLDGKCQLLVQLEKPRHNSSCGLRLPKLTDAVSR